MELHRAKDFWDDMEYRSLLPGFQEYATGHPGPEHQSVAIAVPVYGIRFAQQGSQPLLRPDSGLVVSRRSDGRPAAIAAPVSALHHRCAVPRQCGQLQLPCGLRETREAAVAWSDGQRVVHILQTD